MGELTSGLLFLARDGTDDRIVVPIGIFNESFITSEEHYSTTTLCSPDEVTITATLLSPKPSRLARRFRRQFRRARQQQQRKIRKHAEAIINSITLES